jgi:diguanylate cyclase (GGDEF)-like protein
MIGLAIRNSLRSNDIAGRYGGDEFTVLCKHTTAKEAYSVAMRICEKLRRYAFANIHTAHQRKYRRCRSR